MATVNGKKTGGRKKGTPNRATVALEELLDEKRINPIVGLKNCLIELSKLRPYETKEKLDVIRAKANIYMDIMQYLHPKRRAIDGTIKLDSKEKIPVEIRWADEEDNVSSITENEATDASSSQDQPK